MNRTFFRTPPGLAILFLLAVLVAAQLGLVGQFSLYILTLMAIYGIVATGLTLFMGYTGQLSLGQAAFYGIGAYAAARLTQSGWPFPAAMLAAGILSAAIGCIVGLLALRLRGFYLAVTTLAIGLIAFQVFKNFDAFTGGVGGLGRIPTIAFGPFKIDTPMAFLSLSIVILIAVLATSTAIVLSPTGRAMRAIASNELAARSIGIGAYGIKTIVFTLAAFFAGIAGSLYAHLSRFIAPDDFGFMLSIVFLTMTIVGGLGNILGGLVGAVLVTLVAEHFRAFPQWQPILHGSAMVLVVLFMPYGICGGIQRLVERFRKKSKPAATARPQPLPLPAASLKG